MSSKVAACLSFRNSSLYLAEWLAFHQVVGVDHFFLYDNNSTDDYRRVIQPWLDRGLATLHVWPGVAQQAAIYQHCLTTYRDHADWIAFLDDDEFLWPIVDPDLPTAMERYASHAGVGVCWFLFGSSMHETRPPGLVIENFTWKTVRLTQIQVKCVVDPRRVLSPREIGHSFNCVDSFVVVDESGRPLHDAWNRSPSGNFLRINHYITKSLEELHARRAVPRADNGQVTEHSMLQWEYWAVTWNQVEDHGIQRFLPAVRTVLREFTRA